MALKLEGRLRGAAHQRYAGDEDEARAIIQNFEPRIPNDWLCCLALGLYTRDTPGCVKKRIDAEYSQQART